jgi:enamine deaminase RidA (YjgF/YER057c/UK114 family)
MRALLLTLAFTLCGATPAAEAPQSGNKDAGKWPLRIPAPHGEVILPTKSAKQSYDEMRYAAVRRVDDTLYLSGQIIGRRDGEGNDAAAFKLQVRRGFERLKATLEAAGASFNDVVMINSFHVWNSPHFAGTRDEHFAIVEEVVGEFIKPPYPAWTAVGTTGLLWDAGLIEIQLIARVP